MIHLLSLLVGIASWYGADYEGKPTASGELFDPSALTAASWHHPLGSTVEVTNPQNGKTVRVLINDRGPAKRLGRLIDLSEASFEAIADPDIGLVTVQVRRIDEPEATGAQ